MRGEGARSGDPGENLLNGHEAPDSLMGTLNGTHKCTEARTGVQVCSWRTRAVHMRADHTRVLYTVLSAHMHTGTFLGCVIG